MMRSWRRSAARSLWSGALQIRYPARPTAVFTAGAPGSGKTYTVHQLFGLDQLEIIDLDKAMKGHPEFTAHARHEVYEKVEAYKWADARVEELFQAALRRGADDDASVRICVDGTGTNVARQQRRMSEARGAGFWVVCVHVHVAPEVCLARNARRKRRVPRHVILDYLGKLESSVSEVLAAGLVDEYIRADNSTDDTYRSEAERWQGCAATIEGASATNRSIFDAEDEDLEAVDA